MKKLGIDRSNVFFSLRATIASLWALWIGFRLGLDSPQWAAITVWVVTQPSRGKTLSKAFYRFLGTCVGALFAVFLIHFFGQEPAVFLILLALWVGLSTAVANLVQYFRSYGSMLAGFTAALVGLAVFSHPDQVMKVAEARVLSIFLGIAVALFMASFLSQGSSKKDLFDGLDKVLSQVLQWSSDVFLRRDRSDLIEGERQLVTQISAIEELTSYAAAESMQVRKQKRNLHSLLASLFAAISAARAVSLHFRKHPELVAQTAKWREKASQVLLELSNSIQPQKINEESSARSQMDLKNSFPDWDVSEPSMEWKVLKDRLIHFQSTISNMLDQYLTIHRKGLIGSQRTLTFHRDLRHASLVGIRSTLAVLLVGVIWLLSHWPLGPLVVIMTAVNCGIFATSNNPKSGILVAFRASLVSIFAAFVCLEILAVGPQNMAFQFLLLALFLIPGGLLVTHPTRSLAGTLYCANLLVFVSPNDPIQPFRWDHFLSLGIGFFTAMLLTFLIFYFIFPTDPVRRSRNMLKDIVRDMERMAKASSDYRAFEWETLMYNRVGGLIKVLAETGEAKQGWIEGCFAILDMGQEIIRLRALSQDPKISENERTVISTALRDLSSISENPLKVCEDLKVLAQKKLPLSATDLKLSLLDMSDRLGAHLEFLRGF